MIFFTTIFRDFLSSSDFLSSLVGVEGVEEAVEVEEEEGVGGPEEVVGRGVVGVEKLLEDFDGVKPFVSRTISYHEEG